MHILEQWKINDIERKAERAVGRLYELDALRSDVASLERSIAGLSACVDGLRATLDSCLQRIEMIEANAQMAATTEAI